MEKLGLYAALFPLLTTFILGFLAIRYLSQNQQQTGRSLALVLGFCVGYQAVSGGFVFPPKKLLDWFPYFALFMAMISPFLAAMKFKNRVFAIDLLSTIATYIMLRSLFRDDVSEVLTLIVAVWAAWMLVWLLWDYAFAEQSFPELPLFAVLSATGLAVVIGDSSIVVALVLGCLASAFGALFLLSFKRGVAFGSGIIAVFQVLYGAALIYGHFFNEVSLSNSLLCAAGLFPLLLLKVPKVAALSVWKRAPLLLLLTLIPYLIAAIRVHSMQEADPYSY